MRFPDSVKLLDFSRSQIRYCTQCTALKYILKTLHICCRLIYGIVTTRTLVDVHWGVTIKDLCAFSSQVEAIFDVGKHARYNGSATTQHSRCRRGYARLVNFRHHPTDISR